MDMLKTKFMKNENANTRALDIDGKPFQKVEPSSDQARKITVLKQNQERESYDTLDGLHNLGNQNLLFNLAFL